MKRGKTFRSRFDMRLHQLQDTADHLEEAVRDQATALAEQTREGLVRGQKAVTQWERSLEKSVRANPMLFAGGVLVLIALLLFAKDWKGRK
jgi:hypothetical protein